MTKRLFYFAIPISRHQGRLLGGEPLRFLSALDAEEGGELLARMSEGVVVYQQLGDPENDVWDDPELLAVYGDITEAQVCAAAA
ncbi:hypothetical protein O3U67_15820 [Brevundimonas diminuta]|uniref:hypothetical protein n=1 Tax=Brevundimonas diminuta TaxID=293 RepID=UPI0022AE6CA7|nr:hypothetical protein [Brevundimonas diminuta]MCZ4109558.1 hypothetical protein [Brevundimonas diminuta]